VSTGTGQVQSENPYRGDYQDKTLAQALRRPIGSSLEQMRNEVDKSEQRINRTQMWGIVLGALAVLVPVLLLGYQTYFGAIDDLKQKVATLEGSAQSDGVRDRTLQQLCLEIRRAQQSQGVEEAVEC
jgi:Tfp pilus assembly protein PilN